jgi:uncharacterized protein (TIGR00251 family)
MTIKSHINNGILSVHAKPNSPKTEVLGWDESKKSLKIAVAAVPDKDRANIELLKFLKKETGMKPELVSGTRSREKLVKFS